MTKKSVDDYVEQVFPIECRGRNESGEEVLDKPVKVKVKIYKSPGSNTICSDVSICPYNTGGHGQRCKAAYFYADKVGEGNICPYCFDIPHALEYCNSKVAR